LTSVDAVFAGQRWPSSKSDRRCLFTFQRHVRPSWQISDFFPSLPRGDEGANIRSHAPSQPVRSPAQWRFPSEGGYAWARRHRGRPYGIRTATRENIAPTRRVAPRKGRRASARSPRADAASPASAAPCRAGQWGRSPWVGADSRRPSGAWAKPRDDLSPARQHAPGSAERSAARSPLCDSLTRVSRAFFITL